MNFDRDEKLIAAALEALDSEITCPELMKGIDEKMKIIQKTRKIMRRVIVAAVVAALLGATAFAAKFGGFDLLVERAEVPFGKAVEETFETTISNGIRMSVIAKQSYGNMLVLYMTLEDTEGLGRVDESTSFSLDMNGTAYSCSSKLIHFDEETGVAAYQLRFDTDEGFAQRTLKLNISSIFYGKEELGEIVADIDLAAAVAEGENIGKPYQDRTRTPDEKLTIGHVADIRGMDDRWVSAIGVLHGYLTVQTGISVEPGVKMVVDTTPYLRDPDGNIIKMKFGYGFSASKDLKGIETLPEGRYVFSQRYFDVDTENLEGYTLCFEGRTQKTQTGNWELTINFEKVSEIIEVTTDINVRGVQMNDVRISLHPFGMALVGDGVTGDDYAAPLFVEVVVETTKGDILLWNAGAVRPDPEKEFECTWQAEAAIDVDSVTAIRIGDNRIVIN